MTITPEQEARIKSALSPEDYAALLAQVEETRHEARSARLAASTEKSRADHNEDTIAALKSQRAEDRRLAQVGRTAALRFSNPRLSLAEEAEVRRTLIDAHLTEGA